MAGDRRIEVHDVALHPVAEIIEIAPQFAIAERFQPIAIADRQLELLGKRARTKDAP